MATLASRLLTKHVANILGFILLLLPTIANPTQAQTRSAGLVLSPPTLTFEHNNNPQTFAVTARDHSSISPTITVTDPGPCSQIQISAVPNQGPAILVTIVPPLSFGTTVCHVEVADPRLGTAQLLVTTIFGASNPNGAFGINDTLSPFISAGGGNPQSQMLFLLISNINQTVNYVTAAAVEGGGNWLQVTPASGTSSDFSNPPIEITAVPGTLAPGVYHGTITISATNLGDVPPLVLDASLTVGGNTALQVGDQSIANSYSSNYATLNHASFNYQVGKSLPPPQTFALLSGGKPLAVSAVVAPGSPWLEIEPNGRVLPTPAAITMQLTPVAMTLPAGSYDATIKLSAPEASNPISSITVTLNISEGPALIFGLEPTTFNFQIGGPNPPTQTFTITTTGDPVSYKLQVNPYKVMIPAGNQAMVMVSASPATGTVSAESPATITMSLIPLGFGGADFGPGIYGSSIAIYAEGALNYSGSVNTNVNISNSAVLNAAPSALNFSFQSPQQPPAPQTINLSATSSGQPFTVAVSAACNPTVAVQDRSSSALPAQGQTNWFTVSPSSGVIQGTTSVPLTVRINPAITSAETCGGSITLTSAGTANTIQIPVTLTALADQ